MLIRPIKNEDAEQIIKINEDISSSNSINLSRVDFTNTRKLIASLSPLDHMLIMETETPPEEICAVLLLRVDPQIYLRRLATAELMVASKWQGQGIGKALLMAAIEMAEKELMMERIEVEISVDNVNALKLCKSLGFKVEGRAKDWALTNDGKYIDAYMLAWCRQTVR